MSKRLRLARHGLQVEDLQKNTNAGMLLNETIKQMEVIEQDFETISEEQMISSLNLAARKIDAPGRETLVNPINEDIPYSQLDTYVRGIVRWMNELNILTINCCDGHKRRPAVVHLLGYITANQKEILQAATPSAIRIMFSGDKITFHYEEIADLLKVAENLYNLFTTNIDITELRAEHFKHRLLRLLQFSGESGNEIEIRNYLLSYLRKRMDYVKRDRKGNVLAAKFYGDGPTILLSAHMDVYSKIEPNRDILEHGSILTSSTGILGADDRAGIAAILETITLIENAPFNGTLKVAFTVEEEVGCVGSKNIDKRFVEDVDGAIVIDRRGIRDIVTSNFNTNFCDEAYGEIFEQAGELAGMNDWKTTVGGLSDAATFTSFGIPTVNLSAGYLNEHTSSEQVDYIATYETALLVTTVLQHGMIGKKEKLTSLTSI
ncbi:M20/M25/M40 family metallo-hydrolase [Virgibacillus sp. W0181]|uniref:M20/M25/M40 family metallo-hydrolase n=1 Tax=Virgibacillus sp. W0181 TaxID=3391581 RepID=UPI003F48606C